MNAPRWLDTSTEEPEQSRFCQAGVGANLFAKGPVHSPKIHFLNDRLREQVRSHGLRPESKADLCVTMGTPRGHAVPEALEAEEPEQSRFCPAGVGANLFAKGPVHSPKMHFLNDRLREQVRSHGLRPESKADLCVTMGTPCGHAVPEALEASKRSSSPPHTPPCTLRADTCSGCRAGRRCVSCSAH